MIIQYNNHWTSTHRKTHRIESSHGGQVPPRERGLLHPDESGGVRLSENMGLSQVMGIPQARWMVYFMEHPKITWMNNGYPHGLETSIWICIGSIVLYLNMCYVCYIAYVIAIYMFSDLPPDIPRIGVYICVLRQKGPGNWAMTHGLGRWLRYQSTVLSNHWLAWKRQNNSFMILGFA